MVLLIPLRGIEARAIILLVAICEIGAVAVARGAVAVVHLVEGLGLGLEVGVFGGRGVDGEVHAVFAFVALGAAREVSFVFARGRVGRKGKGGGRYVREEVLSLGVIGDRVVDEGRGVLDEGVFVAGCEDAVVDTWRVLVGGCDGVVAREEGEADDVALGGLDADGVESSLSVLSNSHFVGGLCVGGGPGSSGDYHGGVGVSLGHGGLAAVRGGDHGLGAGLGDIDPVGVDLDTAVSAVSVGVDIELGGGSDLRSVSKCGGSLHDISARVGGGRDSDNVHVLQDTSRVIGRFGTLNVGACRAGLDDLSPIWRGIVLHDLVGDSGGLRGVGVEVHC